jgi:hypothetical protein
MASTRKFILLYFPKAVRFTFKGETAPARAVIRSTFASASFSSAHRMSFSRIWRLPRISRSAVLKDVAASSSALSSSQTKSSSSAHRSFRSATWPSRKKRSW